MIETDHLKQVAREERGYQWGDLHEARSNTIRNQWSIWCDHIKERVKALTPLVGPTPWDEVQLPLLGDGIHQQIPVDLGIGVDLERVSPVRGSLNAARSSA
ncbi:hypothetical protein OG379_38110 [Streptomyces sp. NBC_01166]|uniref:hypothetical protein n=1 Tax=Streptomyces sp. NBC_01166 TaxID=2903755 RepID=UPI003867EE61|nr:hypothetical protein OG379_38110 [Streptomyces sp. NBC_01166]